jgi:hypothetical protein
MQSLIILRINVSFRNISTMSFVANFLSGVLFRHEPFDSTFGGFQRVRRFLFSLRGVALVLPNVLVQLVKLRAESSAKRRWFL